LLIIWVVNEDKGDKEDKDECSGGGVFIEKTASCERKASSLTPLTSLSSLSSMLLRNLSDTYSNFLVTKEQKVPSCVIRRMSLTQMSMLDLGTRKCLNADG